MAIQLAKARGLSVTTTCSARNVEFCQGLGADRAIDYNTQRFEEVCAAEPFDGVIDLIGGSVEVRSLKVLKRSGTFVSVLNSGWIKEHGVALAGVYMLWQLAKGKALRLFRLGPKYTLLLVQPNGQQLEEVAKLVAAGAVKPVVDRVLPLSEAAAAHEYLEKGHARGKVILQVNPSEKSPGT